MQRLDLNLASNPFRNNTLLWAGYGGAAVLLTVFTVWNVSSWVDYRARLADLRSTVGTFATQRLELATRAKRADEGIRRFDVEALDTQAHKANEIIQWKAFSWTRLFNALERVLPNGVRMNSVRPIFNAGSESRNAKKTEGDAMPVAIEGTARTFGDLAELQQAFNADPQFGRIEPERLNKADNGEYIFALRFMYLPENDAVAATETAGAPPTEATSADLAQDAAEDEAEPGAPPAEAPPSETESAAASPQIAATEESPPPPEAAGQDPQAPPPRSVVGRGKAPRGARRTRPGSTEDGGPR